MSEAQRIGPGNCLTNHRGGDTLHHPGRRGGRRSAGGRAEDHGPRIFAGRQDGRVDHDLSQRTGMDRHRDDAGTDPRTGQPGAPQPLSRRRREPRQTRGRRLPERPVPTYRRPRIRHPQPPFARQVLPRGSRGIQRAGTIAQRAARLRHRVRRIREGVANGEIGIFALNGEAYIKKLKDDKDGIFLISLNEKYEPIRVGENDRLDIFGKVLGKCDSSEITRHSR